MKKLNFLCVLTIFFRDDIFVEGFMLFCDDVASDLAEYFECDVDGGRVDLKSDDLSKMKRLVEVFSQNKDEIAKFGVVFSESFLSITVLYEKSSGVNYFACGVDFLRNVSLLGVDFAFTAGYV